MDTNEMIALLLPPNGCFACSDTRKEIAEELARRSVDLERECADADKICAALGLTVDKSRTEGGSLNVPRIVGHIQETLTALRESHAFGVAMSDKYVASRAPECAAAQKPVAWATPSLLVTLSAVEKNHLTNPDRRTRGGEFESAAADAERYSVPLYAAPPAQAEPQEGDLLHTMMEWARTEEGRKQLADSYRPHLWACAKRVADPQNEAATCRHWCGDIEHCQPIASAPAQAEPQPEHAGPIAWLRTLNGDPDWQEDCVHAYEDDARRNLNAYIEGAGEGEVYSIIPLYAAPPAQAELAQGSDEFYHPMRQVMFRAGLLACREYMARFVAAQDPAIAQSIRANWWPNLGPDPGAPRLNDWSEWYEGEYPGGRVTGPANPSIEALPHALTFLEICANPDAARKGTP